MIIYEIILFDTDYIAYDKEKCSKRLNDRFIYGHFNSSISYGEDKYPRENNQNFFYG